jgi:hypothetical protein
MNADKCWIRADDSFFDRLGDRTAQPVNSIRFRTKKSFLTEGCAAFPSLPLYHNGGNSISLIRHYHALIGVHPVKLLMVV